MRRKNAINLELHMKYLQLSNPWEQFYQLGKRRRVLQDDEKQRSRDHVSLDSWTSSILVDTVLRADDGTSSVLLLFPSLQKKTWSEIRRRCLPWMLEGLCFQNQEIQVEDLHMSCSASKKSRTLAKLKTNWTHPVIRLLRLRILIDLASARSTCLSHCKMLGPLGIWWAAFEDPTIVSSNGCAFWAMAATSSFHLHWKLEPLARNPNRLAPTRIAQCHVPRSKLAGCSFCSCDDSSLWRHWSRALVDRTLLALQIANHTTMSTLSFGNTAAFSWFQLLAAWAKKFSCALETSPACHEHGSPLLVLITSLFASFCNLAWT